MRLMLGTPDKPSLLVLVDEGYNPTNFKFWVVNGAWEGTYTNGYLTIHKCPGGDFSSLDKIEILTDNQDRLRSDAYDYQTVFNNFHNPNYVSPSKPRKPEWDYENDADEIPF